ncbi:RIP metalloprotease RseP [bacterium]|nr:RIP metalloprotease RseP [bacterium]
MATIIIFILILGVLIFVHEAGHFLAAVRNGIKADEFGFGFPPRICGLFKDEKSGKYRFVLGNREIKSKNTVYSLNWIPLGGFVKIKGENGEGASESDSFSAQPAWTRIKVLAAGVAMNFFLAWILLSIVLMIGAPQAIDDNADAPNAKVQISQIVPGAPAEKMGLKIGDEICAAGVAGQEVWSEIKTTKEIQILASENKGREIILKIRRGQETLELRGTPRIEYPEGQGPLGISLARTAIVNYPWYESIWRGLLAVFDLTLAIFIALGGIIKNLFLGEGMAMDIAGPVGIAVMTKQAAALGLVYVLQFAAILSVNLGIINGLPFPALDGGRILFILIEKIKGSRVSQKVEQALHTAGFFLLIALMVVVTFRDFIRFEIVDKIRGLFG